MNNPFAIIDSRLGNIEALLLDLKYKTKNKTEDTNSVESYISKKEAASFLGVSPNTIDNYRRRNLIKSYKIGNNVLFKLSEIQTALETK